MKVYCTTKNDPLKLVYLGTSVAEAEAAVGDFSKYQKPKEKFPVNFLDTYSVVPTILNWELIQYFAADGWWYSIVMFDLSDEEN